jgi:hypothetical protein
MRRTAGKRVLAGLAVLGMVVISGLLAAWGVTPPARHEISAADVVALRFPADWTDSDAGMTGAVAAASPTYALASVSATRPYDSAMLFNPNPTWIAPAPAAAEPAPQANVPVEPAPQANVPVEPAPQANVAVAPAPQANVPLEPAPQANLAVAPAPEVNGAVEPTPAPSRAIKAEIEPDPKAAPKTEAKPVVVARSHPPVHHAAVHARRESRVLFNEAQLASIKARLKLSDYQAQYWPAVAAALRALGERAARAPVHQASAYASEGPLAGIDPDGPEVQQLKSAAFPLIMSMNDEQKNQVRTIAHVMGLEQVASSF